MTETSPFEVNIDSTALISLNLKLENYLNEPLKEDLFDNVLKVVHSNLSDTLSRFIRTSDYRNHLQHKRRVTFALQGRTVQ